MVCEEGGVGGADAEDEVAMVKRSILLPFINSISSENTDQDVEGFPKVRNPFQNPILISYLDGIFLCRARLNFSAANIANFQYRSSYFISVFVAYSALPLESSNKLYNFVLLLIVNKR